MIRVKERGKEKQSYVLVNLSSTGIGCSLSDESKFRLTNTQTGSDLIGVQVSFSFKAGGFSSEKNKFESGRYRIFIYHR